MEFYAAQSLQMINSHADKLGEPHPRDAEWMSQAPKSTHCDSIYKVQTQTRVISAVDGGLP